MPQLQNKFSAPANRVLAKVQSEVQRLNHSRIEPEHVMLVLMKEESGTVHKILVGMGIDQVELEKLLVDSLAKLDFPESDLSMSDETRRILNLSMESVAALDRPYLGTEHLMMALMRDLSNRVYPIMRQLGITYNDLLIRVKEAPLEELSEAALKAQEQYPALMAQARLGAFGIFKCISPVFWLLLAAVVLSGMSAYWGWLDSSLSVFLFVTLGWIVSVSLHEFGHAVVAYYGGDRGVLQRGYLTLNPLKYTHGFLSIILPVLFLALGGIGLPGGAVYINMAAVTSRQTRSALSAAGPMVTGVLTLLLAFPFASDWYLASVNQHRPFWAGLSFLVFVQVWALVLNLLPLPGLDGFGILRPYLSEEWNFRISRIGNWTFFLLIMFFMIESPAQRIFFQTIGRIIHLLGVDFQLLDSGIDLYRFW